MGLPGKGNTTIYIDSVQAIDSIDQGESKNRFQPLRLNPEKY